MSNSLLKLDTLDDRREIHRLLQLLHPAKCAAWLERQCRKIPLAHGTRPTVGKRTRAAVPEAVKFGGERHYRLATDIYFDVWFLVSQHGLDIDSLTKDLEETVKRQNRD